jgi:hypothetical protein
MRIHGKEKTIEFVVENESRITNTFKHKTYIYVYMFQKGVLRYLNRLCNGQ